MSIFTSLKQSYKIMRHVAIFCSLVKNIDLIQLLNWSFDWKYMVRGLVLDKKRGNILKVLLFFLFPLNLSFSLVFFSHFYLFQL